MDNNEVLRLFKEAQYRLAVGNKDNFEVDADIPGIRSMSHSSDPSDALLEKVGRYFIERGVLPDPRFGISRDELVDLVEMTE